MVKINMISVKKLIEYISMESIIKKRIVIRLDENKSLTEIPEGIVEQKCFYKINYYLFLFIALSSKRKNKIIIDIKQISMVTNGWFLTKDRVISLRNAGLTHIQLSLDGKDAKTHERMRGINGIYEKVLDALNFIDDAGISSAVAFSPTQFNIKQFPEVVELLQKFENLREIKVQPLMPLGKAVEGKSELFASEEEYRELVAYIERFNAKRDYNNKFRIDWSDPLDHLRRFTTLNFKNNIFSEIKSDGNLTASAYIPVTVGNLKRHSLKDYWKAGLGKVWDIPVIRELAEFVVCIEDMKYDLQELPKIFYEDNIEIDLVDDDIMHHLEEFTLEKLYK